VSEALSEAGVEEEVNRKLLCPETLLPIRAEQLLIRAGLSLPSSVPSPKDGPVPGGIFTPLHFKEGEMEKEQPRREPFS